MFNLFLTREKRHVRDLEKLNIIVVINKYNIDG